MFSFLLFTYLEQLEHNKLVFVQVVSIRTWEPRDHIIMSFIWKPYHTFDHAFDHLWTFSSSTIIFLDIL